MKIKEQTRKLAAAVLEYGKATLTWFEYGKATLTWFEEIFESMNVCFERSTKSLFKDFQDYLSS
ncbi:chlorohydrolase [Streptococcus pneumoniae]|nr:chlorohydrolase [Streptococcus pneumoniae]